MLKSVVNYPQRKQSMSFRRNPEAAVFTARTVFFFVLGKQFRYPETGSLLNYPVPSVVIFKNTKNPPKQPLNRKSNRHFTDCKVNLVACNRKMCYNKRVTERNG